MTNKLFNFSRFANRLSHIQRFILISLLSWIALVPLIVFVTYRYWELDRLLDQEIEGSHYQKQIRKLIELIPLYQRLSIERSKDNFQGQLELNELNKDIQETLQQLKIIPDIETLPLLASSTLFPFTSPLQLEKKWQDLVQRLPHLSIQDNYQSHNDFMKDILSFSQTLNDSYHLVNDPKLDSWYLIEGALFDLPILQSLIFQFSYEMDSLIEIKTIKEAQRNELMALASRLILESNNVKTRLGKAAYYLEKQTESASFVSSLNSLSMDYEKAVKDLAAIARSSFLTPQSSAELTSAEFNRLTDQTLLKGFKLWQSAHEILDDSLTKRKALLSERFWLSLALSLALALTAFLVGLSWILTTARRLKDLIKATESFTSGNLAVRVPIAQHDEIGRLGVAFNRMTQRLRDMINQLYQLLEGTKQLASGDLRTRIQLVNTHNEFGQVAQSFNGMAQTFENIIRRLQKLGLSLTLSADEITKASSEQESIVIEQEATTREIALSVKQISSTAKNFVHSLKEMSEVAEQTSLLAVKGKSSLTNMESIMRGMVDASSTIASKLGVLNEKAGNITSVMTTITRVADQTNLLSLNASIEAEKAGEYGRSFAVIAREIRYLADQTAVATLDIETIVNEIMSAVSSSVMGVDDFKQGIKQGVGQVKMVSDQLALIIEQVQAFTGRFELVNQGMQMQSVEAGQINEAIDQLSVSAQQITESLRHFHKTIQELHRASQELNLLMPKFKTS